MLSSRHSLLELLVHDNKSVLKRLHIEPNGVPAMETISQTDTPKQAFKSLVLNGKFSCKIIRKYKYPLLVSLKDTASLASQTHFRKRGKGLVNCVYKPCPAAVYSAVQSCCSIWSHDTLHHCLSSNSSLENSEREQGHLSRYYSNRKNTSRIVFRERAYSATGNSRVHYLKSGYVIQLIAFRWDKACIRSSPDPSLSCGSGSGLRD